MSKPSLPQGTRDFGPDVVRKRNYIFNTIRSVFELYGFQPLETPAMENIETLMGKYGEEGDKLIFRILDSGNPFASEQFFEGIAEYYKKINILVELNNKHRNVMSNPVNKPIWELNAKSLSQVATSILTDKDFVVRHLPQLKKNVSDKALKYDLTIPFARYVAMNHNQLTFPFKRYQIQPVWRADRPQKGRYREFYQCDADVVGSNSLLNEAELAIIYSIVFKKLGIDAEIKINNRKILTALAELCGGADKMMDITIAIDKLDKIGLDKVKDELTNKGLDKNQVSVIENYLSIDGSNEEKIKKLKDLIGKLEVGKKGIEEIKTVIDSLNTIHYSPFTIDLTLARGLNYYTGTIFEVKANNVQMGSIGGGGRYDDLTGLFGVPNIPGVGISFGVDRIYDVMEELNLFPKDIYAGTQVLFFNLGENESKAAFALLQQLRNKNISGELYHESSKFDKQFKYAEKKNIPFIVIIGSKEMEEKTCTIKNLTTGQQQTISQDQLLNYSFV